LLTSAEVGSKLYAMRLLRRLPTLCHGGGRDLDQCQAGAVTDTAWREHAMVTKLRVPTPGAVARETGTDGGQMGAA
jgi:hypothetical protein